MPTGHGAANRVAIVGASSLRGKELKLVLEERNFPAGDIVLLDEPVMAGTLTEVGGEPAFIRALDEESFEGARFAFFAGSQQDAEQNWQVAQRSGATVIDLTGALAASGQSTSWIPALCDGAAAASRRPRQQSGCARRNASGSPAAIDSVFFARVRRDRRMHDCRGACEIVATADGANAISTGFRTRPGRRGRAGEPNREPAFVPSDRATVFDAQVAFNLLAGYGDECKPSLAEVREAIARDTSEYLAGRVAVPALQLVQAPVFYGYAVAAYAEFAAPPPHEQLEAAFASLGVKLARIGRTRAE